MECAILQTVMKEFGKTARGEEARLYELTGRGGLRMDVTDFGGRVCGLWVPDAAGRMRDVTVGFDSPSGWETTDRYFGAIVGRVCNRISGGRFTLDGKAYDIPRNDAARDAALHGGPCGWDAHVWDAEPFVSGDDVGIAFSRRFPDGEQGFPGTVDAKVTYTLTPDNVWRIEYEATTDAPTPINLTQHTYFNLDGSPDVLGHELRINADAFIPVDRNLSPLPGEPRSVVGTPFDFRTFRRIGERIDDSAPNLQFDPGYNHNWCLNGTGFRKAAELRGTGLSMEVWTDRPGLQLYTGNFIEDGWAMKDGRKLSRRCYLALEAQAYPDSPNRPDYPSVTIRPGEIYRAKTEYRFHAMVNECERKANGKKS